LSLNGDKNKISDSLSGFVNVFPLCTNMRWFKTRLFENDTFSKGWNVMVILSITAYDSFAPDPYVCYPNLSPTCTRCYNAFTLWSFFGYCFHREI